MSKSNRSERRPRSASVTNMIEEIESDPAHHLAGPFLPQTPLSGTPPRIASPTRRKRGTRPIGFWSDLRTGKWIANPESSFKLMCIPPAMYATWQFLAPYFGNDLSNPFAPLLFISHPVPNSVPGDQRYQKGPLDVLLLAYHIVVWSFVRQLISVNVARALGPRFGIKKVAKLDRFGEQLYAIVYFSFFGCWGVRIMGQLPTWWYNTEYIWRGYPHWDMKPELKHYYLMHAAYWCHQLIVMVMGLEKPRKDYYELIAHHLVTLWLIGWSYITNLTLIGNAVFLSMDLPDAVFAASKSLNYMRREILKSIMFAGFIPLWCYFRIWLNVCILWSIWNEYHLLPNIVERWAPEQGQWLTGWMKYQIFIPLFLLLLLNLFWTFLIFRVAYRAVFADKLDDERSDDEDEGNEDHEE